MQNKCFVLCGTLLTAGEQRKGWVGRTQDRTQRLKLKFDLSLNMEKGLTCLTKFYSEFGRGSKVQVNVLNFSFKLEVPTCYKCQEMPEKFPISKYINEILEYLFARLEVGSSFWA